MGCGLRRALHLKSLLHCPLAACERLTGADVYIITCITNELKHLHHLRFCGDVLPPFDFMRELHVIYIQSS